MNISSYSLAHRTLADNPTVSLKSFPLDVTSIFVTLSLGSFLDPRMSWLGFFGFPGSELTGLAPEMHDSYPEDYDLVA